MRGGKMYRLAIMTCVLLGAFALIAAEHLEAG